MKFILILFLAFLFSTGFAQDIDWQKTSNWKLYDIHDDAAFNYTFDTLGKFRSVALENDTMLHFMANAMEWPKDKSALWMGYFVASCKTTGKKLIKVDISMYGGFLYVEPDKRYYELPKEMRKDWLDFLNSRSEQLTKQ